jgi:sec-independent protein translocase protein TatA
MNGLFEGWHIVILVIVVLILFGSRKLPDAARSIGRSMRILKSEVQGLHDDAPSAPVQGTVQSAQAPAPAQIQATQPAGPQQAQLDALQKQIADLQQTVAANGTVSANGTVPADTQQAQ